MRKFLFLLLIVLAGCGQPRAVTIDITDELMCQSKFLTDVSDECSNALGCYDVCEQRACESYGMAFESSKYHEGRCTCDCLADNKIKMVADYYDTG